MFHPDQHYEVRTLQHQDLHTEAAHARMAAQARDATKRWQGRKRALEWLTVAQYSRSWMIRTGLVLGESSVPESLAALLAVREGCQHRQSDRTSGSNFNTGPIVPL
jgi:hypothetical protein